MIQIENVVWQVQNICYCLTCMVTIRSSTITSLVRKSAPMVALYWLVNFLLTYWFIRDVLPTLESPNMITFRRTFFLVAIARWCGADSTRQVVYLVQNLRRVCSAGWYLPYWATTIHGLQIWTRRYVLTYVGYEKKIEDVRVKKHIAFNGYVRFIYRGIFVNKKHLLVVSNKSALLPTIKNHYLSAYTRTGRAKLKK